MSSNDPQQPQVCTQHTSYAEAHKETQRMMKEMHEAIIGTVDHPGMAEKQRGHGIRLSRIEKIVYGFIGLILLAFGGAVVSLVIP